MGRGPGDEAAAGAADGAAAAPAATPLSSETATTPRVLRLCVGKAPCVAPGGLCVAPSVHCTVLPQPDFSTWTARALRCFRAQRPSNACYIEMSMRGARCPCAESPPHLTCVGSWFGPQNRATTRSCVPPSIGTIAPPSRRCSNAVVVLDSGAQAQWCQVWPLVPFDVTGPIPMLACALRCHARLSVPALAET